MKHKDRLKIRIQSYGKNNHYSIQFWIKTWWIFGEWVSYGSSGSSHEFNFEFDKETKWEIVKDLRKYMKHLIFNKETCKLKEFEVLVPIEANMPEPKIKGFTCVSYEQISEVYMAYKFVGVSVVFGSKVICSKIYCPKCTEHPKERYTIKFSENQKDVCAECGFVIQDHTPNP